MKYIFTLIFAISFTSGYSQDNDSGKGIIAGLEFGREFSFQNKAILFKKVISDSRCPTNVTCIWAGEVKILIGIIENGKEVEEKIISLKNGDNTESSENINQIILNFKDSEKPYYLNALNIYPYPTASRKIEDSEYCLQLKLSPSN